MCAGVCVYVCLALATLNQVHNNLILLIGRLS